MAIQIRKATVADAHGIATVRVTTWRAAYAGIVPQAFLEAMDIEANAAFTRRRFAEAGMDHDWVAEEGSTLVGWGSTAWPARDEDLPHAAEICALYVLPSHWGDGVGHALLAAMEAEQSSTKQCSRVAWGGSRRRCRCSGATGLLASPSTAACTSSPPPPRRSPRQASPLRLREDPRAGGMDARAASRLRRSPAPNSHRRAAVRWRFAKPVPNVSLPWRIRFSAQR